MKQSFKLSINDDWRKLWKIIRAHFSTLPLSYIHKLFRLWDVKVNNKKSKAEELVHTWDEITIYTKEEPAQKTKKEPFVSDSFFNNNFDVLYEDNDILAVNKPSWIAVHPWTAHYTGRTMIDLASHYLKEWFVQLVHRLDVETSWVLIFAKNWVALRAINDLISEREAEKHYQAIVFGHLSKKSGTIRTELDKVEYSKYNKMQVCKQKTASSKTSITEYKVIEEIWNLSLLDINLHTWRMHQIRIHFSSIWHPVVWDKMYWNFTLNKEFTRLYWPKRLFLHAYSLKFIHPISSKSIELKAPIPKEFTQTLKQIWTNYQK